MLSLSKHEAMRARSIRQVRAALASVLALLALALPARAAEMITTFDSLIRVERDGSLIVTESIEVIAEGNQIRRGIYRDFPTVYRDMLGLARRVGFEVLGVERDGRAEAYRIERVENGVRVYVGREDVLIAPGLHRYTLTYRTTRQIGFFEDYDELYWNVTGNGWAFPIARARATIELPAGAAGFNASAYTGPQGAEGTAFRIRRDSVGNTTFETTAPLGAYEGLTVALAWQKGIVFPPSAGEALRLALADNGPAVAAAIGLLLVLAYYLFAWWRVGRDPPEGTIIPLFHPPRGFSPAAVRYVMRMGFDQKAFAAAVIDMAVKGRLAIEQEDGGYRLVKTEGDGVLPAGERVAHQRLFGAGPTLELESANHRRVKSAIDGLRERLALDFEKIHFQRNGRWLVPGLGLSLLVLIVTIALAEEPLGGLIMGVWLAGWSVGCYMLASRLVALWQGRKWASAVFASAFAVPFFLGEVFGLFMFGMAVSLPAGILLVAVALASALFHRLLRAPTLQGRRVMDEIEGFKLYLSVAEQERFEALHPPELTPELFERYLPYALALDVENEWSETFAAALDRAGTQRDYSPAWYRGTSWRSLGATGFASSLGGGFAGAIASSSTAPGTSSGSGGGGSSGGGGGGGGGGGW